MGDGLEGWARMMDVDLALDESDLSLRQRIVAKMRAVEEGLPPPMAWPPPWASAEDVQIAASLALWIWRAGGMRVVPPSDLFHLE
jgi:hypothetical protein